MSTLSSIYSPALPVGIPTQIWPRFTLWQYADVNDGPEPQDPPGVEVADWNIFDESPANDERNGINTLRTGNRPWPGICRNIGSK